MFYAKTSKTLIIKIKCDVDFFLLHSRQIFGGGGYILFNDTADLTQFTHDVETKVVETDSGKELWFRTPIAELKDITVGKVSLMDMSNLNVSELADMSNCIQKNNMFAAHTVRIVFPNTMPKLITLKEFCGDKSNNYLTGGTIILPKNCPELITIESAFFDRSGHTIDWSNANCPKLQSIKGAWNRGIGGLNIWANIDLSNSRFDSLEDITAAFQAGITGKSSDSVLKTTGMYVPNIKIANGFMANVGSFNVIDIRDWDLSNVPESATSKLWWQSNYCPSTYRIVIVNKVNFADKNFFLFSYPAQRPSHIYYPEGADVSAWQDKGLTLIPYSATDDPLQMAKDLAGIS